MKIASTLAAAALLLAGCGAPSPTSSKTAGADASVAATLSGTILKDTGDCAPGAPLPCQTITVPAATTVALAVAAADGSLQVVASSPTDATGRYSLTVPAGTYALELGSEEVESLTLAAGQSLTLDFTLPKPATPITIGVGN